MLDIKIKKKFPDFLLDVAFDLPHGITALFGPSGSGKSLTLKCIAGLIKPDEGRIIVNDQTLFCRQSGIDLSPQKRKIGVVFQNYALFPFLTVRENILFGTPTLSRPEKEEKLAGLLQMMGLKGLEQKKPAEISGGQQQRVALARTMAADPQLILLDEPFSALDSIVKVKLREELLDILLQQRVPAVIVTHDLNEAFSLSDFMVLIEAGQVVQSGGKEAVIDRPANRQAARLTRTENIFSGVVTAADGKMARITAGELTLSAETEEPLVIGQAVDLVIRPHAIRLCSRTAGLEPGRNRFKCVVKKISEDIDSYTLVLQLDSSKAEPVDFTVQTSREEFDQMRITLDGQTACCLPPENIALIK